jgi:hypothetical protein
MTVRCQCVTNRSRVAVQVLRRFHWFWAAAVDNATLLSGTRTLILQYTPGAGDESRQYASHRAIFSNPTYCVETKSINLVPFFCSVRLCDALTASQIDPLDNGATFVCRGTRISTATVFAAGVNEHSERPQNGQAGNGETDTTLLLCEPPISRH